MAQPTMRNREQIMKQTCKASPKVNSDLRGRGVKLLRAIGDDMEYHITLEGKEYTRCGNQYFIRVKNSHNGPYPFWRVHHGKNVHTRIDAAIQDYEDAHAEALADDAQINEANEYCAASRAANRAISDAAFNAFWRHSDVMNIAEACRVWDAMHAEALEMNAKKITPLLTREQNAAYIYQLDFFYQMNAVGRAAEIEGAHVAAIKLDAQMMHDAWDNADEIGRLIELEYAYDEALKMDEEITFVRETESLTADQAMAYAEQWAYSNADIATQELMLERDHIEALSLNDKVDTDLAILRSDIKGFRREHTGARLEEVIDYAIRHTFNRIVQVYGVEIHRDSFTDLARTPEQKAFSGGMKTGANTDITTPLRIICDYMQRFMRNNKDAKLSEAKQRLESKIVVFINDGYDEQHLRQALSSATSSHSREAFTRAFDMESFK